MGKKKTKVLLIANGKGGVGKSTLAMLVADYYHSRGTEVLLVDTDGVQKSVARKRKEEELHEGAKEGVYSVQAFTGDTEETYKFFFEWVDGKYELVVVDTKGELAGHGKSYLIGIADLILIPVTARELDVNSTEIFLDALSKEIEGTKIPAYQVQNFFDKRRPEELQLREYYDGYNGIRMLNNKLFLRRNFERSLSTVKTTRFMREEFILNLMKEIETKF